MKAGADVVFIDTAGRLHTKDNLMAEMEKITKVIRKLVPDAPHHVERRLAVPEMEIRDDDRRYETVVDDTQRLAHVADRLDSQAASRQPALRRVTQPGFILDHQNGNHTVWVSDNLRIVVTRCELPTIMIYSKS